MTEEYPRRDVPVFSSPSEKSWGSDVIAETIRDLGIPYLFLNPGASFRGLHDSLVNHLANEHPQMILVLHEEHAVAMAHGYAKVSGIMAGAVVHSNVGLMHASMAIFNAWADRVPVLVLGATGPVDAAKRRPWIDWLHTAQDQGALIRPFIKWDAQPASAKAAQEALLRATMISNTAPMGPTYVCFDASLQEDLLTTRPPRVNVAKHQLPASGRPAIPDVRRVIQLLKDAKSPIILIGRVSRDPLAWQRRVEFVEAVGASVLTDLKLGAAFPTLHPAHAAPPGFFLAPQAAALIKEADLILSLDWLDLAGTMAQAFSGTECHAKIVHASVDQYVHNGWSMDHQSLPETDLTILCEPDFLVEALLEVSCGSGLRGARANVPEHQARPYEKQTPAEMSTISIAQLASSLDVATGSADVCLIRLPLGWAGDLWDFAHPLDYLGYDGGGGIGSGPGMAVGAALALKGKRRIPIAIIGDGDFLMGATALWTAANARIPLLVIVANNRSFFNDELHQERVARDRGRAVENRWIGQRIADPVPDLAALARSQGLVGIGPVSDPGVLVSILRDALSAVEEGRSVVVDVHVTPGYSPAMSSGMTRSHAD